MLIILSVLFVAYFYVSERGIHNSQIHLNNKVVQEASSVLQKKDDIKSPDIVVAARSQVGVTRSYDPAYIGLDYPMGDVPIETGVCTDVVIRALRDTYDMDLQELVHGDMKTSFSEYPDHWGLSAPDRNIDHRRVPNLQTYLTRRGFGVQEGQKDVFLPGDIVSSDVMGRPHIMIVSDRKNHSGVPLVIHNIGRGAQEEDALFDYPITGHYRISQKEKNER